MKNKRLLTLVLLALSMILTLQFAACNTSSNNQEQTTVDTTDASSQTQAPETDADTEDTTADTEEVTTDTPEPPVQEQGVASKPVINFDKTVQVAEDGTRANVTTATNLSYAATGYSGYANGAFTINADFTVDLGTAFAGKFNRLTLCYVSDAPLNCTVTYTLDGKTVNDLFYLEAGKQTFCALTLGYLDGKQASDLKSITFETCEEKNTSFILCDVKTEVYEVYADDVYYVENDSYVLGVRLSWGGGVCYMKDKKNKI
ncbi:MAG: hypothetical protein J6S28_04470, partial [Clostridia bacterium]|nr:hypothetical protein [Clostridia bacterium]